MDLNFVPCFFLSSSFSLLLVKKRERIGKWQEKVYTRKNTGRTKEVTLIDINRDLTYTVIPAIL